jgi:hypothetical protein
LNGCGANGFKLLEKALKQPHNHKLQEKLRARLVGRAYPNLAAYINNRVQEWNQQRLRTVASTRIYEGKMSIEERRAKGRERSQRFYVKNKKIRGDLTKLRDKVNGGAAILRSMIGTLTIGEVGGSQPGTLQPMFKARTLQLMVDLAGPGGAFFDCGFGEGYMLLAAVCSGFFSSVYGIDYSGHCHASIMRLYKWPHTTRRPTLVALADATTVVALPVTVTAFFSFDKVRCYSTI